jgi:hypothetical protein
VAYAAKAEEISNDKAATVSSAAHMIRSHEVSSNDDALGEAWSGGVGRNVHSFTPRSSAKPNTAQPNS